MSRGRGGIYRLGVVRIPAVTLGIGLLALSALLLLAGAELFAEHAASAGARLGVSALAVGVLLAGAEPEELITAVTAAARGRPGIAVGDAIGANITMLTLALGLAAVLRPLPLGGRVRAYGVGAALTGGVAALTLADGRLSRTEGVVLLAVYIVLVAVVWYRERQPPVIGELAEVLDPDAAAGDNPTADPGGDGGRVADADRRGRGGGRGLALALAGIAVMAAGGVFAVQGAERVVAAQDATDTAVGLTLVALATTAELLALAWSAARRDVSELAVAAVVGSAAYNATATLGAAAMVQPSAHVDLRAAALVAAALPLVVLVLGGSAHQLRRRAGIVLLLGYVAFVALTLG
jgi:cation:H+ antiporter